MPSRARWSLPPLAIASEAPPQTGKHDKSQKPQRSLDQKPSLYSNRTMSSYHVSSVR